MGIPWERELSALTALIDEMTSDLKIVGYLDHNLKTTMRSVAGCFKDSETLLGGHLEGRKHPQALGSGIPKCRRAKR